MIPFDVVLLADSVTSLHPLTDDGLPSCLVPLCNTPMLALAARLLERNAVRLAHVVRALARRPASAQHPAQVCHGAAAARVADWVAANQSDLKVAMQVPSHSVHTLLCNSAQHLRW